MATATTPQGTQLHALTDRQAAFTALANEGKTNHEIALVYGVSSETVRSTIYFVKNRLLGAAGDRVLTARQLEVLALVGSGLSNASIGEILYISSYTVNAHMRLIIERLGARNRMHCVMLAISQEILILDHDGNLLIPHAHRVAA